MSGASPAATTEEGKPQGEEQDSGKDDHGG